MWPLREHNSLNTHHLQPYKDLVEDARAFCMGKITRGESSPVERLSHSGAKPTAAGTQVEVQVENAPLPIISLLVFFKRMVRLSHRARSCSTMVPSDLLEAWTA